MVKADLRFSSLDILIFYDTSQFMRFLLAMLLVSLIFSGYSAAAHAFDDVFCEESAGSEAQNSGFDCHDLQKNASSEKKSDKNSKADCSECHHCCASSAVNIPGGVLVTPTYDAVLQPVSHDTRDGDFIFQLRRPPKSLV